MQVITHDQVLILITNTNHFLTGQQEKFTDSRWKKLAAAACPARCNFLSPA